MKVYARINKLSLSELQQECDMFTAAGNQLPYCVLLRMYRIYAQNRFRNEINDVCNFVGMNNVCMMMNDRTYNSRLCLCAGLHTAMLDSRWGKQKMENDESTSHADELKHRSVLRWAAAYKAHGGKVDKRGRASRSAEASSYRLMVLSIFAVDYSWNLLRPVFGCSAYEYWRARVHAKVTTSTPQHSLMPHMGMQTQVTTSHNAV